jgi:phosphate starvation-inducible protein PhoH
MERTLELKRSRVTPLLFGIQDANLRYLEAQLGVRIRTHDTTVTVVGEPAPTLLTMRLLEGLLVSWKLVCDSTSRIWVFYYAYWKMVRT